MLILAFCVFRLTESGVVDAETAQKMIDATDSGETPLGHELEIELGKVDSAYIGGWRAPDRGHWTM